MAKPFGGFARSRFLAGAAAAGGTVTFIRAAGSAAQFVYKFGDPDALNYPIPVRMVQMIDAIKAETNGRMQIDLYAKGVLGSTSAMLSQLRIGAIQFLTMSQSNFASVVPAAQMGSVGFAFGSTKQALAAMDGALGAYVRKEFASKGLYVFEKTFETGFREVTSSLKPIRTVDDFAGFKIRTLPAPMYVDLFKTFGASPAPIDSSEMYTALQTHVVDGQETTYGGIEENRVYEVQKYLCVTNHMWSGYWLAANGEAWNALPSDIQDIVKRNAAKYTLLERADMRILNVSLADKLKRQGLAFNTVDTAPVRARLGPYYARWKNEFGPTAWGLLENYTGRLG